MSASRITLQGDVPPYQELSMETQARFDSLPQYGKAMAEYVWVGGGGELRCKTMTIDMPADESKLPTPESLRIWNYDGSSTAQAPGDDSEVLLKPQAVYRDPFRSSSAANIIVLCDCYKPDPDGPQGLGAPIVSNTRVAASAIMDKVAATVPWFGIEQEYTLFEPDGVTPYGWPKGGEPGPQGPYYCSAGTECAFGRPVIEAHYKCCMYAGLEISGVNGEVMPGQWEYQIGPCVGIASGDQLLISRYLLNRVCEQFGIIVTYDPKPIPGDWNGAGCHTNVSTKEMREPGGYEKIKVAMERLGAPGVPDAHIAAYGEGNERRLTGAHETASYKEFTWGVANRGCSIRIPRMTEKEGCGYFEDRRPSSNMDPYIVTAKIMETCVVPDC